MTERFPRLGGGDDRERFVGEPGLGTRVIRSKVLAGEERLREVHKAFHTELLAAYAERLQGSSVVDEDENVLGVFHGPSTDRKVLKKILRAIS